MSGFCLVLLILMDYLLGFVVEIYSETAKVSLDKPKTGARRVMGVGLA